MALDTVRATPTLAPDVRDDIEDIKRNTHRKYVSPWVSIAASASTNFTHGLGDFPLLVDVLQAINQQGSSPAAASPVTVTKTGTLITLTNGAATAKFFRVRAI